MRALALRLSLGIPWVVVAGCAAVLGFDELSDRIASDDASVPSHDADVTPDSGPPPAKPVCNARFPEAVTRPAGSTSDHVVALESMHLSANPAESIGLDLDCVTTSDLDGSTCLVDPAITDFFRAIVVDDDAGVDNAGGPFLAAVSSRIPVFEPAGIARKVQRGAVGLVLELIALAAGPDSPGVAVQVFPARGLVQSDGSCGAWQPDPDAAAAEDGGEPARTPSRSDSWCLDSHFQQKAFGSKVSARKAWVRDSRLYAQFDVLQIPLIDDATSRVAYVALTNASLTARIETVGETDIALRDGVIGGRWVTRDILRQIANVGSVEHDASCALPEEVRTLAQTVVCPGRDINASTTMDPALPCDSLSLGIGFSAYEIAERGDFSTVESYDDLCPAPPEGGVRPDQTWDCPTDAAATNGR